MTSEETFLTKLSQLLLSLKNSTRELLLTSSHSQSESAKECLTRWQTIYFPCVVEDDPIAMQALLFSYHLLQDMILGQSVPSDVKDSDDTYLTLKFNVKELQKIFSEALQRNLERLELTNYEQFESVANELFELHVGESNDPKMTWGRMVSLFTFGICLAYKYRAEDDRVEEISRYLAKYILKYGLPFVQSRGGWGDIANELPIPVEDSMISTHGGHNDKDFGIHAMVVWSGLCVGSVATTMFVLSRK